ncbi:MAG: M56 family metallopeptidase [Gelidibacter sp.]
MEYLIKSSAIIAIFYICYRLFLQRDTFFVSNRWFLFAGMVASILIPLLVIPVYVEITPITLNSMVQSNEVDIQHMQPENPFNLINFLSVIYGIGILFFLGKLITELSSLLFLIKRNPSSYDGSFSYIQTSTALAPFSFFNWIVINPEQFDTKELELIINHEKVHARQCHSVDVIVAQLMCVVFWFNPFSWLYKKALQQNLEFIADQEAQIVAPCEKSYQNLLLRTSIPSHQLVLANNFYNSLIKKRIVMLHKSKSSRLNVWKYSLVIPLIVAFVLNFNTEIIAQTKTPQPEKVKIGQNVLRFVITKDTKDSQLESIKEKLAEKNATITFNNISRNGQKEITGIKIDYEHTGKKGNFFVNSDNPIKDITVSLNVNENELTVGQSTKNLSQSFEIITDDDGGKKVKTTGAGSNVFVYSTDDDEGDDDEKVIVIGKDGDDHEVKKEKNVYVIKSGSKKNSDETEDVVFVRKNKKDTVWIKKDVENIVWTDDDGKDVEIITVDKGNDNIKIFTNGDEQPLILLDGKEISKKDMDSLKSENIESVNVLKGEKATEKHGKKGEHGVIEITSKKKN